MGGRTQLQKHHRDVREVLHVFLTLCFGIQSNTFTVAEKDPQNIHVCPNLVQAVNTFWKLLICCTKRQSFRHVCKRTVPDLRSHTKVEQVAVTQ